MQNLSFNHVENNILKVEKLTIGNRTYLGNVVTNGTNVNIKNALEYSEQDIEKMGNLVNVWATKFLEGSLSNFQQVLGNVSMMRSGLTELEICKMKIALVAVRFNMKNAYTNMLGAAINGLL